MKLLSLRLAAGAAVAAGALAVTLPAAVVAAQPSTGESCFRLGSLKNTRMIGHREVLFRAAGNQVFRMDFSADCNASGNEPLILHPFDNNDQICHAIDLNVSVRATHEGCIPTSLRRLSPDEVAQIPLKDRP
jgi:hypothetical protein